MKRHVMLMAMIAMCSGLYASDYNGAKFIYEDCKLRNTLYSEKDLNLPLIDLYVKKIGQGSLSKQMISTDALLELNISIQALSLSIVEKCQDKLRRYVNSIYEAINEKQERLPKNWEYNYSNPIYTYTVSTTSGNGIKVRDNPHRGKVVDTIEDGTVVTSIGLPADDDYIKVTYYKDQKKEIGWVSRDFIRRLR